MLVGEPRVEVVGVYRGDVNELERRALDLQADVILILVRPDETIDYTARWLEYAAPCLIRVETGHNTIHIYHRRVLYEYELDDIVTAILADC